jgi:hypothetical protein
MAERFKQYLPIQRITANTKLPIPLQIVRFIKFFRLLGYYSVWDGLEPTFRNYISIPSSKVKLSKKKLFLGSLALENGTDSVVPKRRF